MNDNRLSFVSDLKLDTYADRKLRSILNNTILGSKQVLLTPLGKAVSPDLILKDWELIFNRNKSVINSNLLNFESENKSKFGPRSIALPWAQRIKSIEAYFGEGPNDPVDSPYSSVSLKGQLRPISFEKARDILKNSTSAGLPYLTSKGQVKKALTLDLCLRSIGENIPCVIFTRTQEGGKTRAVWGYPIALTAFEMMYYRPLLDYQRKKTWRSALLGPDVVDQNMFEIVNSSFRRNVPLLSIDFKQYDANLKPNVQKPAWNYIKGLFQPKYHKDLELIQNQFNNIGLVTPDGIMKGSHGVPSGSTFTNEVDSIAQYVISRSTASVFDEGIQIQGDDAVYSIDSSNVDGLFNVFKRQGLDVHTDTKLLSYNKCEYLRKLYDIDYLTDKSIGGIYSTYRALSRLIYQERWTDFEDFSILGKDYYSIRSICILENCKHHPLFAEFVKFILKLDKYNLKYSQDGLSKYISLIKQTKGTEGIIQNQYGDDVSGIENFATVKILKELMR